MILSDQPSYEQLASFADDRGWFSVRWAEDSIDDFPGFVQSNMSYSTEGTLRGMHYQLGENAQGKLVSVIAGAAFDVVVDMRRSSPDFGRWQGFALDASTPHALWVPVGFAHGFLATRPGTVLLYDVTAPYEPTAEASLRWNDPSVAIDWPLLGRRPVLSPKDEAAALLADAKTFE